MMRFLRKVRNKLFLNATRDAVRQELNAVRQELNAVRQELNAVRQELNAVRQELNAVHSHIQDACMATNVLVGDNISKLFIASNINNGTFAPFKRCHEGKSVVIVGAGPSLNDFVPIPDAIYIGLNRAFLYGKVNFDYLFTIDVMGIIDFHKSFFEYRPDECIKFVGDQDFGDVRNDRKYYQIPESYIPFEKNVHRYITKSGGYFNDKFSYHIDCEPIGNFTTVSLQAMQFALFTNPAKIYLVGIDCNANTAGHFTGETKFRTKKLLEEDTNRSIEAWKLCKDFASVYYPDTEIISVNPIRLKGIFKDWYQSEGSELE